MARDSGFVSMQIELGHCTGNTFATGRPQRCPLSSCKRTSSCSNSSQPVSHLNACRQRLYQPRCSRGGCSLRSVAVTARPLDSKRSTRTQADSSDGTRTSDAELESASIGISAAGEDAANFQLQEQSATSWGIFTALLVGALAALYAVGSELHGICRISLCNSLLLPPPVMPRMACAVRGSFAACSLHGMFAARYIPPCFISC